VRKKYRSEALAAVHETTMEALPEGGRHRQADDAAF
jgi:hypothetical protein